MKSADKQLAMSNASMVLATFDLQKVLCCPAGKVGTIFYKRKLASYNLTVFNLDSKDGVNYMWNESQGKCGSCEIGSCVWKWLGSLPDNIRHVVLYCDSCGDQNRIGCNAALCNKMSKS